MAPAPRAPVRDLWVTGPRSPGAPAGPAGGGRSTVERCSGRPPLSGAEGTGEARLQQWAPRRLGQALGQRLGALPRPPPHHLASAHWGGGRGGHPEVTQPLAGTAEGMTESGQEAGGRGVRNLLSFLPVAVPPSEGPAVRGAPPRGRGAARTNAAETRWPVAMVPPVSVSHTESRQREAPGLRGGR